MDLNIKISDEVGHIHRRSGDYDINRANKLLIKNSLLKYGLIKKP